ncbi:MAG: hypothetical protein K6T86_09500 [Pirellulales bacterium]|nr:hypothetical protein [Pirellulales bacterium]
MSWPRTCGALLLGAVCAAWCAGARADEFQLEQTEEEIRIRGDLLEAVVRKRGYVSGVSGGSLLDRTTGFRDAGFGLDIVDWLMEPGSDEAYRDKLDPELVYEFNNLVHGKIPKRSLEGPQICTQARQLEPRVHRGRGFVAVTQSFRYRTAAPGLRTGSLWEQTLVFLEGKRYFVSCDKITTVNDSQAMFLRVDMPGHIKHRAGDTFSEVYLSYHGTIPAAEFAADFPPDQRFFYRRDDNCLPDRMIRAYKLRDPHTGRDGPWLAGMTLDPAMVSEAWCHQRGYVCMIQEVGGRPIKAGESFSAAYVVGFFDSIEEMHKVYDQHRGGREIVLGENAWRLLP